MTSCWCVYPRCPRSRDHIDAHDFLLFSPTSVFSKMNQTNSNTSLPKEWEEKVFKKSTSPVWEHYLKATNKSIKKAKCKKCNEEISNDGTSAMWSHLAIHKIIRSKNVETKEEPKQKVSQFW